MSAWYVLSMMGIYQTTPGSTEINVGKPSFSSILHLENGKQTEIIYSIDENKKDFVGPSLNELKINDAIQSGTEISFRSIIEGSKIHMNYKYFSDVASQWVAWNSNESIYNNGSVFINRNAIPAVPRIANYSGRTFSNQILIEFVTDRDNTSMMYRINGGKYLLYKSSFVINENSTVESFAKTNEGICSDTAIAYFTKAPNYNSITIKNKYANQYSAGGARALIDGIRGKDNFRTGDWQGYEGTDLDAVVDLGAVKDVTHIAIGFLQDQNAWIFFPGAVIFYSSMDGKIFNEIDVNKNTLPQDSQVTLLHDFYTDKKIKARYIKVVAKNSGPCPSWHPGKGNLSWIFADEIIINNN
jgi:hypothetical protein